MNTDINQINAWLDRLGQNVMNHKQDWCQALGDLSEIEKELDALRDRIPAQDFRAAKNFAQHIRICLINSEPHIMRVQIALNAFSYIADLLNRIFR